MQEWVAQEAVGAQVAAFQVFDLFFVGGDALEPAERSDHGEQDVQLGVFEDLRLHEERGFFGIEADGEPVHGNLQGVFGDRGGVFVMSG